jgi:pSer/pThr/pTyr-binding forkhead associated (FHA) protein
MWQRLTRGPARRPCAKVAFKIAPEITLPVGGGPSTWLLGRSSACDVMFLDPAISRRHALLSTRGGQCSIRDLGSTNGTQVNGEPVETAVLHAGDVLTLAGVSHAVVR